MKSLYRTVALCFTASLLVSCSGERVIHNQTEQTNITLSWWGNDSRNEYTINAVEIFEELHPNIKVECSYSEWSGYESRNRVRMISDTETDVMQINFSWLNEYSSDGNGYYDIEQVADYIELGNFSEDMLAYGRKNGILNAIPIAMNTETVYINKSIYDNYGIGVPDTWEDFFSASKLMNKDGVYPLSGVAKSMWLYCISYAEQVSGKKILDEKGKLNFSEKELQIMINFYVRLVNENVVPQVENYQKYNIDNGIYAGAIAWVSDAENHFGNSENSGNTITVASYTADSAENAGTGWYAKPATLYAISKNTEHPKESAILLDFLLNSAEMAELQGVEKGIPLSKSARECLKENGMLNGIQYEAALKMEENSNLSQMNPKLENTVLINEFIDSCNLVLYDKDSSENASVQLYKTIIENIG